jgi:hypothetical protein
MHSMLSPAKIISTSVEIGFGAGADQQRQRLRGRNFVWREIHNTTENSKPAFTKTLTYTP